MQDDGSDNSRTAPVPAEAPILVWKPGRWYRILDPDGGLWMETSDAEEAREASRQTGWPLEREWRCELSEWRAEPAEAGGSGCT